MLEGLVSPSFDCSGYTTIVLEFLHYYRHLGSGSGTVEVSVDGGTTWTPVATYTSTSGNGDLVSLDISAEAAGEADVMIRFYYDDAGSWAWYWLLDDVAVYGG